MKKKLSVIGNSLGFVIDRPILELLDITRETELDIKTDGDALLIRPVRKSSARQDVLDSAKRIMGVHKESLSKLAE